MKDALLISKYKRLTEILTINNQIGCSINLSIKMKKFWKWVISIYIEKQYKEKSNDSYTDVLFWGKDTEIYE